MIGDYEKVVTATYPIRRLKDVDGEDSMYPDDDAKVWTDWLLSSACTTTCVDFYVDWQLVDPKHIDWHYFWSELSLRRNRDDK